MTPAQCERPLWLKIAQTLVAEIETQALEPGTRLPTEAQLAARFEVNRHTVRRALDNLVRRGLVQVEQGRGAFVADDVLDYEVTSRTRFSEWIRRHNKLPAGRALRLREIPASVALAEALRIDRGRPVAFLERLGLADGQPVALTDHYFPAERLPGIIDALRSNPTITKALIAVGVLDYARRSTRVAARMPTAPEGELLQISRARPLLVCENVNVDHAGRVVEFGVARYPSTRVQVIFEP
jgi:GntR family phosphonate transport system transcriptional regulator